MEEVNLLEVGSVLGLAGREGGREASGFERRGERVKSPICTKSVIYLW